MMPNQTHIARVLVLCVYILFAGPAGAAGIQAIVTTGITDDRGTNGGEFFLSLNGAPLPIVDTQNVMLDVGDVLRAENSAFASGDSAAGGRNVKFDLILPTDVAAATVRNVFSGTGYSQPESAESGNSAYGGVGNIIDCNFSVGSCSAPGLPLSTAFISGVQSSTFVNLDQEIIINNVATPTGRMGGLETFDPLATVLELQPFSGSPSAGISLRSVAQVIFNSESEGGGVMELTIIDLTPVPVPVPAAFWLFGSGLVGLIGIARRKKA